MKASNKWKKGPTQVCTEKIILEIFTSLFCNLICRVIKEAKGQHYCRLIAKSHNKIKSTCNIIKCESGKFHVTEQIPSVHINSDKVNDPQIISDAFSTFSLQLLKI
jgi:hypothetical protein